MVYELDYNKPITVNQFITRNCGVAPPARVMRWVYERDTNGFAPCTVLTEDGPRILEEHALRWAKENEEDRRL